MYFPQGNMKSLRIQSKEVFDLVVGIVPLMSVRFCFFAIFKMTEALLELLFLLKSPMIMVRFRLTFERKLKASINTLDVVLGGA